MYEVILMEKDSKLWSEKMGRLNHLDAQIGDAEWMCCYTEMLGSEIDEIIKAKETLLAAYNRVIKREGYFEPVKG